MRIVIVLLVRVVMVLLVRVVVVLRVKRSNDSRGTDSISKGKDNRIDSIPNRDESDK